uniref:HCLS1 associated protein X-1 n=1 Tax=Gorilla gorilla gorilla TaxID=9595 RepID=A0A2I2ZH13_GORGO
MSLFDLFRGFFGFPGPRSLMMYGLRTPILEPERTMILIPRFPRRVLARFYSPSPNPISRVSL